MLELKEAHFLPKVAQNESKAVLPILKLMSFKIAQMFTKHLG